MKHKKYIFDIGAFDGMTGLSLAIENPKYMVHAFEANKYLIKEIFNNKKKLEKFFNYKIKNYKFHNFAISNKNSISSFNIAKNPTVSSLNRFSKNIDKTWPGWRETHCHFIKKIRVKTIRLENFCKKNNIETIDYLHVDTQGSDLKVLQGLGSYITKVNSGVIETAINKKKALYSNNHTLKEVKKFFKKNKIKILKKENPINLDNEINVYFEKLNLKLKKPKTTFNLRYYNRIIQNRSTLKDRFKKLLDKLRNI